MYFDVLNRLGVDYECEGQTNGQTESPLATRNTFYGSGTWYLPIASSTMNELFHYYHRMHCACTKRPYFLFRVKSVRESPKSGSRNTMVTIVFLDPDFL